MYTFKCDTTHNTNKTLFYNSSRAKRHISQHPFSHEKFAFFNLKNATIFG